MKYIIDASSHVPAYHQLYLLVREDIINGIYPTGSKLPSKRTVALDSNTSTVTVEHAYALLCDEGYIESRERSGFFVIFRADDGFVSAPTLNVKHKSYLGSHTETYAYQFTDYSKYNISVDRADPVQKKKHLEEEYPKDLDKAYELGRRMCQ